MSMHEFEDLVEMSVRVLDACERAQAADLRSIFYQLYEFQALWDTGFTHFRVMDILLKHRFVYRMEMSAHPDYLHYQQVLDQVAEKSRTADASHAFVSLRLDPSRDLDRAAARQMSQQAYREWNLGNPVAGYYRYPYLYADAGSPLWQRMVAQGQLTGVDALPPQPPPSLMETVAQVATCAEAQQHYAVLTLWYALLASYLAFKEEAERVVTPALETFIAIVNRSDALRKGVEQHPYLDQFARSLPLVQNGAAYIQVVNDLIGSVDDL